MASRFQGFSVTLAAQRFVFGLLAQEHLLVHIYQTMAYVGQCAAPHADGVNLAYFVGYGKQSGHGAERFTLEVEVKSCNDDTYALIGQRVTHIYYVPVEELCLVYTYDIVALCHKQYAGAGVYGGAGNAVAFVAHDILAAVTRVHSWLEYFHPLLCEYGTLYTANEFLRLAGKHGAAYNLYPTSAHCLATVAGHIFHTVVCLLYFLLRVQRYTLYPDAFVSVRIMYV